MKPPDILFSGFDKRSYTISIVLFFIVSVSAWKPPPHQKKYPVCRTSECTKMGTYYFINMNLAEDPCKDFYRFACGDWSLKNPRPKFALEWTVDDALNVQALSSLRDFLERPPKTAETDDEVKAKKLYYLCTSRNELHKGDIQFVTNHILSVAEYSRRSSLWGTHDQFLRLTGESAFFSVRYTSDSNNIPLLQFKEIDSPYGSIYHVAEWEPNEEKVYVEFLRGLLEILNSIDVYPKWVREDRHLLQKVIAFRHALNVIARENFKEPTTHWAPTTATQLLKWFKKITYMNDNVQINWASIVRILYPHLSQNDIYTKPVVTLRRKEYFTSLAFLLSKTAPHVLVTHMQLHFMERHLNYDETIRKKLEGTFSKTKYTGRIREEVPRWMVCLEEHGMQLQLAQIYVKNFFLPINKPYLRRVIEDMRDILKEDIKKSWLQDDTKKYTMQMLDNLKSTVGFPTWNIHPDERISIGESLPIKPNSFYDPDENKIYLAATAASSPLYEPGLPLPVNIAGIGSVIAHELYRMFGDCGFYTFEGGTKSKVWWPRKDREVCEARKQCFVEEYNLYARNDFLGLINPSQTDSRRKSAEDIADVMGLHLAYRYYKQKSKRVPQACQMIPNFEDFTCDQLFFIAYANTMCGEISSDYLFATYAMAKQNPRSLRVNGALRNLKAFGEVFGCRSKTPMNPSRKCSL